MGEAVFESDEEVGQHGFFVRFGVPRRIRVIIQKKQKISNSID